MKRSWVLAVLLSCCLPIAVLGTVKIVGDATDYVTITNAIANAGVNDVIRVSTGTYYEVFNIESKTLTIDGKYDTGCVSKVAGATVLKMSGFPFPPVVWVVNSDAVLIDLDIADMSPVSSTVGHGGGLSIEDKSDVRMAGCRVYNNQANGFGGGIYVTNSSLTLTNCLVFSNRAVKALGAGYAPEGRGGGIAADNSYVEIYGDAAGGAENSIKWNYADHLGGGLYVANKSWCIISNETSDVLFNSATNGGGIAVSGQSKLYVLSGSDVCGNTAEFSGGGILLEGSSTGLLRGTSANVGFNALTLGPNVTTDGTLGRGGGIAVESASLRIEGSAAVAHNRSAVVGGGIYLSNSTCVIDDAFVGYPYNYVHTNEAGLGGGMLMSHGSVLVLTNHAFVHGNVAAGSGGGIFASAGSLVRLYDSTVRVNTAVADEGGGIYLSDSSITGRNSGVHNNRALRGGGLYAYRCTGSLDVVSFTNNAAAGSGGAILWIGGAGYPLVMTGDSRVWDNVAGSNGAGIAATAPIDLTSAYFNGNQADHHGGAVYISNAVALLKDVAIEYNTADADLDSAGNGGGIWVGGGASLDFGSPLAGYVPLGNNQAYSGGGLYAEGGSTVTIHEDIANIGVDRNSAARNGAGIAVENSTLTVTGDVTFIENTCLRDGGGIYGLNSTVRLLGGVVVGDTDTNLANRAGRYGGGLAVNGCTVALSRVTFISNVATSYSGGADVVNSWLSGTSVQFTANQVLDNDGGGVYAENTPGVLALTTFASNSAGFGGGGLAWFANSLRLASCRVSDNRSQFGGGMELDGCDAFFTGVEADKNQAVEDGGGILLRSGCLLVATNLNVYGNAADSDRNRSGDGGGLFIEDESQAWLYGTNGMTLIVSNTAYVGGGIGLSNGYLAIGGKTWIEGNAATNGGGIYLAAGTADVARAYILRNVAALDGGGVFVRTNCMINMLNCLLAGNVIDPDLGWGGGVWIAGGAASLGFCTVYSNVVGGVECAGGSELEMYGCIAYGHSLVNVTLGHTVNYSDVEDGYIGVNNFDAEPRLNYGNYHLTAWSPCRNAGWAATGEVDVDGEARAGNVDVGFDEFVDGDNDNLPDVVETDTGTWADDGDMGTDPAAADSDGDGIKDGDEWLADTDPNNEDAFLRFTSITNGLNVIHAAWVGGTNAMRRFEVSRDFHTTNSPTWQLTNTELPPTPGAGTWTSINSPTVGVYRIRASRYAF